MQRLSGSHTGIQKKAKGSDADQKASEFGPRVSHETLMALLLSFLVNAVLFYTLIQKNRH